MLTNLQSAASNAGHPEWGYAGPSNAGYYNSIPQMTGFFSDNTFNNYNSAYGTFFLKWYSSMLIQHGADVLSQAKSIFAENVRIAAKIAGIHWWYFTSK